MEDNKGFPAPFSMSVAAEQQLQPPSLTPRSEILSVPPSLTTFDVKPPWKDGGDFGMQNTLESSPAPAAAPESVSSPLGDSATLLPPMNEHQQPSSPAEPHPTPAAMSPPASEGFIASSSPEGSPNRPPTPPEKPSSVNAAKLDELKRQITSRTAAMDAATKAKEEKIITAAQMYLKELQARREEEVAAAKASHKQEQHADTKQIDDYRERGAVWGAVQMLVDLQKPNQYSKSTELMRSVLSTLSAMPP